MGAGDVLMRGVSACQTTSGKMRPMSAWLARTTWWFVPRALAMRAWKPLSSKAGSSKAMEKVSSGLVVNVRMMAVMVEESRPPLR